MTRDLNSAGASSISSASADINPEGGGAVTFINVFEVPVEQIDTFIAHWRELAKIMSAAPCPVLTDALPDDQRRQLGEPTGVGSRHGELGVSRGPACSDR